MSGLIWNHVPTMLRFFEQEGAPFPTFAEYEMSDLIAYLHSDRSAPVGEPSGGGSSTTTGMTTAP